MEIMNLKTAVIITLLFSCAASSEHERKKWKEPKEKPDKECDEPEAEPEFPLIGSVPGTPGVDFPNLVEIPNTGFICPDKDNIPEFYPDLDTGCQVFHVCYENRRESFLCPVGTIFSAPLKTCDYWYSADCLESTEGKGSDYFKKGSKEPEVMDPIIEELIAVMLDKEGSSHKTGSIKSIPKYAKSTEPWSKHTKKPTPSKQWTTSKHTEKQSTTAEPQSIHTTKTPPKSDFTGSKASSTKDNQLGDKDSAKKSDLAKSMKETAEIASVILQSLLPVKSKVIKFIAEESRKSKSSEDVSKRDKDKPIATNKPKTTTEFLKTTVKPKTTTSTPKTRAPEPRPERIYVPVKAKPMWQSPKKPVSSYKPEKPLPTIKGLPVSSLTKKHLALNYAKLWKLKHLGNPLMGLLKAM